MEAATNLSQEMFDLNLTRRNSKQNTQQSKEKMQTKATTKPNKTQVALA